MEIQLPHRRHAGCRGFTLVEVLVSLVILGIGLLGIAKLMMFSSHSNDSAYMRSQATELAYEILDAMRANRTEAMNGSYTATFGVPVTSPGSCVTASCSSTQLAQYDLYTWKHRLLAANGDASRSGALPSGDGQITTASVNSQTTVTIQVQWDDTIAQSAVVGHAMASLQTITLESIL